MNTIPKPRRAGWIGWMLAFTSILSLFGDDVPVFRELVMLTNREAVLKMTAPPNSDCRLDATGDLKTWAPLAMLPFTSTLNQYTDSAAPYLAARSYRARQVPDTNVVTGDILQTSLGDLTIHPVDHASLVLCLRETNAIYCDPVGGAALYKNLPPPRIILLTHDHADHFDVPTLTALGAAKATLIAPSTVYKKLSASLKDVTTVLTNGSATVLMGIDILAVPMHNLVSSFHPKGAGNGYVLTMGDKRIYLAGDTEDIPEMLALQDISVAFIPINQPSSMTVAQAVNALRTFRPRIAYPYHYRGTDLSKLKSLVGQDAGVEVRLRKWY